MAGLTRHPGEVANVIQLKAHWCGGAASMKPIGTAGRPAVTHEPGLRVKPAVTHNAWCLSGGGVHVMAGLTRHPGSLGNAFTRLNLHGP